MDSLVKQRLVGALILVALAVVFWPIIFLPATDDKNCLGAFYADREDVGPPLQAGQYKFVTMRRSQLILAIKYRR